MEKREIIVATNETIKQIVKEEIEKYGLNADLNHIDVSQVTNLSKVFMFSHFNGDISKWDVYNVKDMSYLFYRSGFNQDILNWNTGNVERMTGMFLGSCFDQDISKWDVSKVKYMDDMFAYSVFNGDISRWNTGCVENMAGMFNYAKFNGDISQWDVGNVRIMLAMFKENHFFNNDISKWNVSKVKNMSQMFYGSCFNQDISQWDVSNVEEMNLMFFESKFNQDISSWNVSKLRESCAMFYLSCFNQDLSCWNVKELLKMENMFNVTTFKQLDTLKSFIKQKQNKEQLKHFCYFPKVYNVLKNKQDFLNLICFDQKNKSLTLIEKINYLNTNYPFLACETFHYFSKTNKYHELEMKINEFSHYFKDFNHESKSENLKDENVSNLDVLLNFLIKYKRNNEKYFKNEIEPNISHIFNKKTLNIMLLKLNELLKVLNKSIDDFVLVKYAFDTLFELEKKLIKDKNSQYLQYVKENNQMFSDMFDYYSLKQKQELLNLIVDKRKLNLNNIKNDVKEFQEILL